MGQISQLVFLASIVASCISYYIDSTSIILVPEPPVEPSESDFSEFPTEFMNKLIASLSPDELEELHKPTILGETSLVDRDGNTDKTPCHSLEDTPNYHIEKATDGEFFLLQLSPEELEELHKPNILGESSLVDWDGNTDKTPCHSLEDTPNYHIVKATDGEQYYVITNRTEKYQPVIHYVCDKHGPNDNKCEPANSDKLYGYCCHQHQNTTTLYVIPVPRSRLDVRNKHLYLKGTNVKYEGYRMIQKDVLMNSYCGCDQSKTAIKKHYTCPNPESDFFLK